MKLLEVMALSVFKITEKVINGFKLDGFILQDDTGKRQPVSIDTATKLARAGKILGAEALLDSDTGGYILHIEQKLGSIETNRNVAGRELCLTARILDENGNCIGYKAKDHDGKDYKLSINKAWKLAVNNSIHGVKAEIVNGYKIIISTEGFRLEKLPKLS